MMEIWVVITVARQEYGETIFIKTERAFKDKQKAEEFADSLSQVVTGKLNIPNAGEVNCSFERGIYKVELE